MNRSYKAALAAIWIFVCVVAASRPAAAQSASGWLSVDIGSPLLAGSTASNEGRLIIDAAGEDIWGTQDQFHFVYQAVSGDFELSARVDSITKQDPWSKAGVMVRSSLAADAAHGTALVSAGKGVAFQRRVSPGGLSTHTSGPLVSAPRWVRIVRTGTDLATFSSADGITWVSIGRDTVALGASVYAGIAVTSHDPTVRTTASVSNLALVLKASLPPGQSAVDIGAPAIAGTTSISQGTYTIRAAGLDIWGTADQFHYVYQPVSGDLDVKARVASIGAADAWSKAGVMIRESLAPGSPHATVFSSAAKGYAFQYRPLAGALSKHISGGTGTSPVWVRVVRQGDTFESFRSADGVNWVRIGSIVIPMNDTVLVGLAVTSHNTSQPTTAVIDQLAVSQTAPTANASPSVVISSPSAGTTIPASTSLAITATASDPDGSIDNVEFYVNATMVGRDSAAPYTATTAALPAGTYQVKAVATDDKGATAISSTVDVVVGTVSTVPDGVAFRVAADHATAVTNYVLDIHASGSTPGATAPLASLSLGKPAPSSTGDVTVSCQPFFQALAPGTYLATVRAVGSGGSARSAPVTFSR